MTLRPGYMRSNVMIPVVFVLALTLAIGVPELLAGQPALASEALLLPAALSAALRLAV